MAFAVACGGHTTGDGARADGSTDVVAIDTVGMDIVGIDTAGTDATIGPDAPIGDGPITVGDAVVIPIDGGTRLCYPIQCSMHQLQCGDCVDNDHDGLTDSDDPDCLGPCSNSEGPTLDPNVGGGTASACTLNCYFDYGIGAGSDGCHWDHTCDPLEVAPNYPPRGSHCAYDPASVGGRTCPASQSTTCIDTCRPLTPNGCDCFGCCTFPSIAGRSAALGGEFVYLGSRDAAGNPSCTLAGAADTALCHSCTPVRDCFNECGHCEVCLGRPTPPADCFPPPPPADGGYPDVVGVDVVGVNCSDGPQHVLDAAELLVPLGLPVSAMPNAGLPRRVDERFLYVATPEYFGVYARRMYKVGVRLVGG
ncbi:MAG: homocysteine S-methyltransferase family protein [Deltaproteobacteria bacterium]